MEKAKDLDAELSKNDQDGDGFADTPVDLSKSELEGKDDFFKKAEAFAEGRPMDGSTPIEINTDEVAKKETKQAFGFEDLDGDGNEIIDDAIIEEE